MSVCEQCSKPSKFLFICPKCGGRYCSEHKSLEAHNCESLETIVEYVEEIVEEEQVFDDADYEETISEETQVPEFIYQETWPETETEDQLLVEEIVPEEPQIDIPHISLATGGLEALNRIENLLQAAPK